MRRQRRELEIFSLYFLDGMCCAFGAVIMLLLITKAAEPRIIEQAKADERGLIAALQQELFAIRGETDVLDRQMQGAQGDRQRADQTIARLSERQRDLVQTQSHISSNKQILRASDDPVNAARAERAMATIARSEAGLRSVDASRNAMTQAESALGDAGELLQRVRELLVAMAR